MIPAMIFTRTKKRRVVLGEYGEFMIPVNIVNIELHLFPCILPFKLCNGNSFVIS